MFNIIVFLLNLVALTASLTWVLISKGQGYEPMITSIGLLVSQLIFAKKLFSHISLFLKDIPVNVVIMGDRYCGKSVYITCAFNQLQRITKKISFSLSDYNTIERIFADIHSLRKQKWLPITIPSDYDKVFCYKGTILKKGRIISKKFNISLADYSGEEYERFSNKDTAPKWFHESLYFRYVLNSDVIFLSIDISALKMTKEQAVHTIDWQIQRQIASLHIYMKEKSIGPESKIKIPICLLIMKSDLIPEMERSNIERTYFIELTDFCKNKCVKFRMFWVTSTGVVDKDGSPVIPLMPQNVAEPIIWAVFKL